MTIGIDISQIVYEGTGVSRYMRGMVEALLREDKVNEYILFGATLRRGQVIRSWFDSVKKLSPRVRLVCIPVQPSLLDILWNRMHILPVELFIGAVDIFWSSDWTQPPLARARGVTTIHDVSFLRFPESFAESIVAVQKRRLARAKSACQVFFCDSEATRRDVISYLGIPEKNTQTLYPGFSLSIV